MKNAEPAMPAQDLVCPACAYQGRGTRFIESFAGGELNSVYRLVRCGSCGLEYSFPMSNPGGAAYMKLYPEREFADPSGGDWRYDVFFSMEEGRGRRLLDVGCGDGSFLEKARSRGFLVSGIDYAHEKIRRARERGLTDVHAGSIEDIPRIFPEAQWDRITLFDVLEHLADPALVMRSLCQALEPDGMIIVTVPNGGAPRYFNNRYFDHPPYHLTRWSQDALRRILTGAGFEPVRMVISSFTFTDVAQQVAGPVVVSIVTALKRIVFRAAAVRGENIRMSSFESLSSTGGPHLGASTRRRVLSGLRLLVGTVLFPLLAAVYAYHKAVNDQGFILMAQARKKCA